MEGDTRMEGFRLEGMADESAALLPPWEAEWTLFGPIPNEGDTRNWPGRLGFSPLALDAATTIPDQVVIEGRTYRPITARSTGGRLDLAERFHYLEGCPIAYLMTWVETPAAARLPISFGANWGTQWWVGGRLVYQTREGNFADPEVRSGHQFYAPLEPGRNLVVVKVISGGPAWTITLSRLALVPPAEAGSGFRPSWPAPGEVWHAASRDYAQAGLRIEERPGPVPPEVSRRREQVMADHGVHAHWIGIVDPTGTPYGPSQWLPPRADATPEQAERLRRQVAEIHGHGMAAMTWFPGTHCRSAAEAHPDWRVVGFDGQAVGEESFWNLCIHSPYGEALVEFVLESLDQYDLDGFWFDGTIWANPIRGGCWCVHCRQRFRQAGGADLPRAVDWHDPVFRRWVAWRYAAFMEYWGRLASRVRRRRPHATIVINHLHRLGSSWIGAVPIDRYEADVLAGSEAADSPFDSAFHARQQRAYGRTQAEVWMGIHKLFTRTDSWPAESHPLHRYLHHALACLTAGVMPSFGTPDPGEKPAEAYRVLGDFINRRRPFVRGQPEPYAGLHLSQQAETFYFSRRPDLGYPAPYWHSVAGWHHLLCENQALVDIVFDSHLTAGSLAAYAVWVAPLSVALSDAQVRRLETYVADGGVLVVGPWLGACDEWGEPADPRRMERLLGRPAEQPPGPDRLTVYAPDGAVHALGRGRVVSLAGNVGLRFFRTHSGALAEEVGRLIRGLAPPRLTVEGPRRLHLGLYRDAGRLWLHVHNFIAYSQAETFPNPILTAPAPAEHVRVTLRGYPIGYARRVLAADAPELPLERRGDVVAFTLPTVEWAELIELGV